MLRGLSSDFSYLAGDDDLRVSALPRPHSDGHSPAGPPVISITQERSLTRAVTLADVA